MTKPINIGVDLGGTSVRVGVFDAEMKLLERCSIPTRIATGPDAVVADMAQVIKELLRACAAPSHGLSIGIGSPGPLNLINGTLMQLPNFPNWDGYPLRDKLRLATGLEVILDCDANAAALAEWKLGAGQRKVVENMAMITLGTGVGSGIVLNGRLWHGMVGMAGEVGHVTVDPDGPRCACGGRGCLELFGSARGVMRLSEETAAGPDATAALKSLIGRDEGFTALDVAELANGEDRSAKLVFSRMGRYLGLGLAGLVNTLDLPLIVIGGGVAAAWPLFSPAMFATLREYSFVYRLSAPTALDVIEPNCVQICPAVLGDAAGLLGAALLPSFSTR